MTALRVLASRLLAFLTGARRDARLNEEIQAHLDLLTEDHLRRGLSLEDARAAARRAFGGVEQLKETHRDQRGVPIVDALLQDVCYGFRTFRKNPGFTGTAVLSLALGVGANCAIFSVLNAVLLKDLPVKDPDRLASVVLHRKDQAPKALRPADYLKVRSAPQDLSYPMFRDLSSRQQVLEMAASGGLEPDHVRLAGTSEFLHDIDGGFVSANYFTMLGVNALVGRVFTSEDSRAPGEGAVAVIGHGFWERHFARQPSIVGRTILINQVPFTIIGVAPRGFFGDRVGVARDIWVPILMQPRLEARDMLEARTASWFRTIGRLNPGVSDTEANAELTVLFQQLKAHEVASGTGSLISRERPEDFYVEVQRGSRALNSLRRRLQQPLALLMGVVALFLLIACGNVANLLLARGLARQREIAVRLAIGSSRHRLVRQLLTESLMLSLAGGTLGLVFAHWTSGVLVAKFSVGALDLRLDAHMFAFALAVSLLIGVLFGLFPALQATSADLAPALQASPRGHRGGPRRQRLSRILVVSQVAFSLWLLIGAGLLVRSLQNLRTAEIGVDRRHVLTIQVQAAETEIPIAQVRAVRQQLLERLGTIPGVGEVALSTHGLFTGSMSTTPVRVPGSRVNPEHDVEVRQNWVSPRYFHALGMALLRGRVFGDQDAGAVSMVTVINETMARDYFGERNPIGQTIYFPKVDAQGRYVPFGQSLDREQGAEVVGVVRDAKYDNLRETAKRMAYMPIPRGERAVGLVVIRTTGAPRILAGHFRQALSEVGLVARSFETLEQQIDTTLDRERMVTTLLGLFGGLAVLLASVGLGGVMAYAVARRTSEIGIRMALGATRGGVVAMVLRETLLLVTMGVALGVPLALATTHLLQSLLFGLTPTDPSTIAGMAILMLAMALLAGLIPARRAASVDPMAALRCD